MTNVNEIWKNINGFSNYEINQHGDIRRVTNSTRGKSGYYLKSFIHWKGYRTIRLRNSNGAKTFRIHRLVAETFIPNPNNLPQVNHINGVKTDNYFTNLEWCDNSYNQSHSYRVLNKKSGMLGLRGLKNKKSIRLQCTATGNYYSVNDAAKILNISYSSMFAMLNGKFNNWTNFIYG